VVDDTARSLVTTILRGVGEAKRQSIITALQGLDVEPSLLVEAILPLLDDAERTRDVINVSSGISICITFLSAKGGQY